MNHVEWMLNIYSHTLSETRIIRLKKILEIIPKEFYPEEVRVYNDLFFFSCFYRGISCIVEEYDSDICSVSLRRGYYPPRKLFHEEDVHYTRIPSILQNLQYYDNSLEEMSNRILFLTSAHSLGNIHEKISLKIREKAARISEGFFSHGLFFNTCTLFQRTYFPQFARNVGEDHIFPYYLHLNYYATLETCKKNLIVEITEDGVNYLPSVISTEYSCGPKTENSPETLDYFSSLNFLKVKFFER